MDLLCVIIVVHQPHMIGCIVVDVQRRCRADVVRFAVHKVVCQVVDLIAPSEAVAGHRQMWALEEAARASPASILHTGYFSTCNITKIALQFTRIAEVTHT